MLKRSVDGILRGVLGCWKKDQLAAMCKDLTRLIQVPSAMIVVLFSGCS